MKIALCVPAGGGVNRVETTGTIFSIRDHDMKSKHRYAFIHAQGCDIPYNRNRMVDVALKMGIDAIMWVDADVTGPADAVFRLLAHKVPIVGASYRRREQGNASMMGERTGATRGELMGMNMLPGGFVLVRREVYEAIEAPWYSEGYVQYPYFATDDFWFCQRAKEAGFDIWCDPAITDEVSHYAVMPLLGDHRDINCVPADTGIELWQPENDDGA